MPYIPRFDTLRAVAALLVVYGHYFEYSRDWFPPLNYAGMGVWFFFVLSGFLITSVFLGDVDAEPRGAMARFYVRRAFRIFPLYYLATAIGVALDVPGFRDAFAWIATYLINLYYLFDPTVSPQFSAHFWSLAVEEQFYLVWPALIVLFRRKIWTVGVSVVAFAVAYKVVQFGAGRWPGLASSPLSCADALMIGALSAIACREIGTARTEQVLRWLLPVSVPGLLVFGGYLAPIPQAVSGSLAALFFAWITLAAVKAGPSGSSWGGCILPFLGRFSYGIYVYHYMILGLLTKANADGLWGRTFGVVATLVVAWASWRYIEEPLRKYGRDLAARVGPKPVWVSGAAP